MFLRFREGGYSLRLANNQEWCILAAEEVQSWVRKFAELLELKNCPVNGCPKLIFTRKGFSSDWRSILNYPQNGWIEYYVGSLSLWFHKETPDVICEISKGDDYILDIVRMSHALFPVYRRAQTQGGVPLHAALLEVGGRGLVLAAPGNRGKSTCCRRLPSNWKALCDDEALIVRTSQKEYFTHPFPTWSDYLCRNSERTWNVQQHVCLSAILFLEQSDVDKVVPVGKAEAAACIVQSSLQLGAQHWGVFDKEEEKKSKEELFYNACELIEAVPVFVLRASLNGEFWKEIEKVLDNG